MGVRISNIVDVEFEVLTSQTLIGSYGTTVFFTNEVIKDLEGDPIPALLVNSYNELASRTESLSLLFDAQRYFEQGGVRLLIINPSGYTLDAFKADLETARDIAEDFIYVVIDNVLLDQVLENKYTFAVLKSILDYSKSIDSNEDFRILLTTNSMTYIEDNKLNDYYVAVKYSTKIYNNKLINQALLIGAYFSKIDLNGTDTIKDYCFTPENYTYYNTAPDNVNEKVSYESVTNVQYSNLVNNPTGDEGYYNFIGKVGNRVLNFGGNYANGISMQTDFGTIALEKDISFSVLSSMIGKLYLSDKGLANVVGAIDNQLQRYKTNGYLNIGSHYSGTDKSVTYNNISFNIINRGKLLPQGYLIYTIPILNISEQDRLKKKFTPIYVVIESQAGARVIEIRGEVRG